MPDEQATTANALGQQGRGLSVRAGKIAVVVRSRVALHLEVLALRHQLQVLQRSRPTIGSGRRTTVPARSNVMSCSTIESRLTSGRLRRTPRAVSWDILE